MVSAIPRPQDSGQLASVVGEPVGGASAKNSCSRSLCSVWAPVVLVEPERETETL